MHKTEEFFTEAMSLPVDIRTSLVDKLLESLNPTAKGIEALWATEAERRVEEVKSGKVRAIPGEQIFEEIRKKMDR